MRSRVAEPTSPSPGPSARARGRSRHTTAADLARRLYGPVAHLMPAVEQRISEQLQSRREGIAPVLLHGLQLGGKRLRPALVLLSAAAIDSDRITDEHLTLGAVIEMVHTATLVHDDILDAADRRRHLPTIHARWGGDVGVLLGDYLFAQAFRLSATLGSTEACRQIGEAARRVCEGELRQVLAREETESEANYVEMLRGKTGELCAAACRLGALFAGADETSGERLATYGASLGIAFQIADDYLDLWGEEATMGKTLGTDLSQGKWTLPVLRLLQQSSTQQAAEVRRILAGPPESRHAALMPLLEASDAREYTLKVAESYRDAACESLSAVPHSPARRSLIDIAGFAVARNC